MRSAVLAAALLLASSPARADDPRRAKMLFDAGTVHYEQGQYEAARREFEEAYRLAARPALLYNVAQCYEKLGELEQTIYYLHRYLNEAPDASDRGAVEGWLRSLEERRKARPAGEAVPATRGAPPEPASGDDAPATTSESPPPVARAVSAQPDDAPPSRAARIAAWSTLGAGAALAIAGVALGVSARSTAGDLNEADRWDQDAYDSGRGRATAAYVLMGVGGAVAAAGGVWAWLNAGAGGDRLDTRPSRPCPASPAGS